MQVHIVMELCTGGSLVSRLGERLAAHGNTHGFGEAAAASLVEEMLSAVLYCHQHGVVRPLVPCTPLVPYTPLVRPLVHPLSTPS